MVTRRDFLLIPAAAFGVMIANVAISIGVVWVYSTFFNPGQPFSRYEAFAATAAPISSVVAGIPLMLFAGDLLARRRIRRDALFAAGAAACLYGAVDGAILIAAGLGAAAWTWAALSFATKLLAALAGAALRSRAGAGRV
jgi:hypothetical protein